MENVGTTVAGDEEPLGLSTQCRVRLSADSMKVVRGEKTRLTWTADGARDVRLWRSQTLPFAPEPLNWTRIVDLAERVPHQGEREITIDSDTAFYLVAISETGIKAMRLLVEVQRERETAQGSVCQPSERLLQKMEEAPHVGWRDYQSMSEVVIYPSGMPIASPGAMRMWFGGSLPPIIAIKATAPVIFTDESSTITWSVVNSTCVTTSLEMSKSTLLADAGFVSGSKYDGGEWGAGGSPTCAGPNPGSWTVQGGSGPGHVVRHVSAQSAAAASAAASQSVDILGIPKFEGACTPTRKAAIRAALKDMDERLRKGRVYNDAFLDTQVAAFKKGCLNRHELWARLLAELQNLNITPIKCEDVATGASGSFEPFTGRIYLRWKPAAAPNLSYVLCHELAHKAGLHNALYACGLTGADIEDDADRVASAILEIPPG